MAKFATTATPNVRAPIKTTGARALTGEGGVGYERDAKSELFLLAVSNMVREDTFYEAAAQRDERFVSLIHTVVAEDPAWVAAFVPYLRDVMQMRSSSLVMAAEYVNGEGPNGRAVVASALQRPDEPAEMLGYWHQMYGRKLPAAVKRGVADACTRLYNERAALRYNGTGQPWRMADVVELVRPKPAAEWQSALFKFLLDSRHHPSPDLVPSADLLPVLWADWALQHVPEADRRATLGGTLVQQASWSWERLSGWLPGGMDAEAWEAIIPQMGYMALLRNLRNFDQAGVSDNFAETVCTKLATAAEVENSRQFPFRFLSAFREIESLRWAGALEKALDFSLANVPSLPGTTLILVDLSGSMYSSLSGRTKRERWEVALIFGAALAKRAENASLVLFGTNSKEIGFTQPLLKLLEQGRDSMGGTHTMAALQNSYAGQQRIVIVTDEQAADVGYPVQLPPGVNLFTFNLAGYRVGQLPSGEKGMFTFGGLTDAGFSLIPIIEAQQEGKWAFTAGS